MSTADYHYRMKCDAIQKMDIRDHFSTIERANSNKKKSCATLRRLHYSVSNSRYFIGIRRWV